MLFAFVKKLLTKTTLLGEENMKEITCPGTIGMVKIFDEMAIKTRILALNLAVESGRGELVKKISKGIFSKAVGLCDSIEMTAQEISGLLKTFSDKSMAVSSQKTIAKLDELADHIGQISSLATQNQEEESQQPRDGGKNSSNEKLEPEKALFKQIFEIQDMLKRFRSDIAEPAAVS